MDKKEKITIIPDMPSEIIDAIDANRLIIFVGAGLSKLFRYPLWNEFAFRLVDNCVKEKSIPLSEKKIWTSGSFSSMKLVTIAYDSLRKKVGDGKAFEIFKKELTKDEYNEDKLSSGDLTKKEKEDLEKTRKKIDDIAKYLSNYHSKIVTTNADLSIDRTHYFKGKKVIKNFKNLINDDDIKYADLVHIHGTIEDYNSLVFTSEQYAAAYMIETDFGQNLKKLLKDHVILFIGYGVNEFELIKYFLTLKDDAKKKMFILEGFLKNETVEKKFLYDYYKSLHIELLDYSREKEDYDALIGVLKAWDKDVKTRTMAHKIVPKKIDEVIKKKPTPSLVALVKKELE